MRAADHLGRSREDRNGYHRVHADHREGAEPVRRAVSELDVASQGATVKEAASNLREAVELFLQCTDPEEVKRRRLRTEVFVTRIEAKRG
jgi:hypothetical protein